MVSVSVSRLGGAEDGRALGGEMEEEAILVGCRGLVRGAVNGN
jgi:hypothetical protein